MRSPGALFYEPLGILSDRDRNLWGIWHLSNHLNVLLLKGYGFAYPETVEKHQ